MIRFHTCANAKAAIDYFSKSDGYYAAGDLRTEWLGKGAAELGLSGKPDFEHFKRLIHGHDPHTGDQLTSKIIHNRIPAWDVTASTPKGVTIALERGDSRIQDALWEAARETLADLEQYATTRVRKGGALDDRLTGNLVAYAVEHPETRPAKADNYPDPDRHIHLVIMNVTKDPIEGEWKAVKFRPIMDLRKYFDRKFDMRLASKLTDLGYGIETKLKPDHKGAKRYYSWDIKDMPQSVVQKFSRRAGEVEKLAADLGVVSATGKDKLGATSRQFKRTDKTLADYRKYWDSRVTPEEARQVAEVIKGALEGTNPLPLNTADVGVRYAIEHEFERKSVMNWHDLAITAMERCMGGAKPEEIEPEAIRQGTLFKDGQVTTKAVLAEESRIIDFAREGKGTMRPLEGMVRAAQQPAATIPLGPVLKASSNPDLPTSTALGQQKGRPDESKRPLSVVSGRGDALSFAGCASPAPAKQADTATLSSKQQAFSAGHIGNVAKLVGLSPEQAAMVNHVLDSSDRVILVIGDAGTGKTRSLRTAFDAMNKPVEILAPSAEASRGVLRSADGGGFSKADTVASFLLNEKRQAGVNDGVIWVDEAGLLAIKDLSKLTDIAKQQNARIVLQGDPKQHHSVVRHGNMMNVLQEYAGLPVGRLTEIWRQRHTGYKAIVADIAQGKREKAFDQLADLGWVQKVEDNTALVNDYMAGLKSGKDMLVIAPSHAEGDEVTAAIRSRLKEDGKLGTEEHRFAQLVPLNWSEAEKGDLQRYDGSEVLCVHRNSGTLKAGQKVAIAEFKPGDRWLSPAHFSVHRKDEIGIATGDLIRFTANGKSLDGHELNNGSVYRIKGFDKDDNLVLDNNWVVGKDFKHITHGYVNTSHSAQGKTVDRVLVAMGSESKGAISAEQFYVSVSRARESAKIYSDMPAEELKQAIQRTDTRKSATELMQPRKKPKRRVYDQIRKLMAKARHRLRSLRIGREGDSKELERQKERERGGHER